MMIATNITNCRELAGALVQYMNTRAVYLGLPAFAYQIGNIYLSREVILSGDDLDGIFPFLEIQCIIDTQPKQLLAPMDMPEAEVCLWLLFGRTAMPVSMIY